MSVPADDIRFAQCEISRSRRQLWLAGSPAQLGARAFDVLLALIDRRERVVSASELLDIVWPDVVVEENNLRVHICALRKLLGAAAIATVPGRGYRFTSPLDGTTLSVRLAAAAATAAATAAAAAASSVAPGAPPTNLPEHLPPLYGRVDDVQEVKSMLLASRLVTLVGAGGIGKTRLAQAVAHQLRAQWPDGAWLVELAAISKPSMVPSVIAHALGVTVSGEAEASSRWVAGLSSRTQLVVLDTCEHLIHAVAAWVGQLLMHAPGVRVLVTSQTPLHLAEEQQFRVWPLAVPDRMRAEAALSYGAVALFEARARAVESRFVLNDGNVGAVIDICRRLGGLPLAIELAAARVSLLGVQGVADRLGQRFRLLTGGRAVALHRHQTLRAALEWSHGLLSAQEQQVFRRLGVFVGGFTMELARLALADEELDEWDLLDDLACLVDRSLVEADTGETPRYRLPESTRAYALEQLAEAGETGLMLQRHARAVHACLLQTFDDQGKVSLDAQAAQAALELDNVRAAMDWAMGKDGDTETALSLATLSRPFMRFLGLAREGRKWMLALEDRVNDRTPPRIAAFLWVSHAVPVVYTTMSCCT